MKRYIFLSIFSSSLSMGKNIHWLVEIFAFLLNLLTGEVKKRSVEIFTSLSGLSISKDTN